MPARCTSCGEEALTDTALFCIGCGAGLPEFDPREVLVADVPQPAPPEPRSDVPAVTPRPVAPRAALPPRPAPRASAPPPTPLRDLGPVVPPSLVVAGVIGLLALLLILLLAG